MDLSDEHFPKSPFAGLINLDSARPVRLLAKCCRQLVKGFMKLRRKYKSLIDPVRPEWEMLVPAVIFFALWTAISGEYEQTWSEAKEKRL